MLINREKDFQRPTTMAGGLEKLILGVQDYNWGKVTSSIQLINKLIYLCIYYKKITIGEKLPSSVISSG